MSEHADNVNTTLERARERLLAELLPEGRWEGELSSSAVATAIAAVALKQAGRTELAQRGFQWLETYRNVDGGWGDSPESPSNFTATLLCRCMLDEEIGTPQEVADSILKFYGDDLTFSAPILTLCMLCGKLGDNWSVVPQLPFELAVFPHRYYRWLRLPVVSYALPALIAIGLVRHKHCPARFQPLRKLRDALVPKVLNILENIQPESGGFLEAAPLTGFVGMSLHAAGYGTHPVAASCFRFLETTMREDGSWAIDVNLSTWLTSLSVRALDDVLSDEQKDRIRDYLLAIQWHHEHPFTHAAPGGWGWTNRPGGVPDADDTAAALLALRRFGRTGRSASRMTQTLASVQAGIQWLLDLQNRDGGMPTFCRGWGKLPFDRSCPDLTAHAIRAWLAWRDEVDPALRKRIFRALKKSFHYLGKKQRADGSWLPLWFGNQYNPNHENPVYGTTRVLEALMEVNEKEFPEIGKMKRRAFQWLETMVGKTDTLEETAMIAGLTGKGVERLIEMCGAGTEFPPAPIGLYFASLWYSERLYPLIFTVEALRRIQAMS